MSELWITSGKVMNKPIYCGLAFGSVSIGNQGELRPCCGIVPSKFKSIDDKEFHPIVRINTKNLREVRKLLSEGVWPETCGMCKNTEDLGSESMRTIWNKTIPDAPVAEVVNPADIKYLDLSLGNKCNSKCMTCNPYCSDFWSEEYSTIIPKSIAFSNFAISKSTIYQLLDTFKNVRYINLLGGEPMFSDEHRMLLNQLIESGTSKDISISYVSNLTVYDESLANAWKQFKSVGASLSMDGIGPVNDYLRYPAKFDKIEYNLKRYLDITNVGEFGITLSCTISIFNFVRFPDLLDYYVSLIENYDGENVSQRMAIYLNYVNSPAYFNSALLSNEFRKTCLPKLHQVRDRISKMNLHPSLLDSCNTLEAWANEPQKQDPDAVNNAISFINKSDAYRKRDIKDFIPEVWEELNKLKEKYGK